MGQVLVTAHIPSPRYSATKSGSASSYRGEPARHHGEYPSSLLATLHSGLKALATCSTWASVYAGTSFAETQAPSTKRDIIKAGRQRHFTSIAPPDDTPQWSCPFTTRFTLDRSNRPSVPHTYLQGQTAVPKGQPAPSRSRIWSSAPTLFGSHRPP